MSLREQPDMNDALPDVRVGDHETKGARGSRKRTKAGMSLKGKDMPICDCPIKVLDKGDAGDFAPRYAGETNPRGLRYAGARRYKNSGPNKPKAVIFPVIYRLQRKSARFSGN